MKAIKCMIPNVIFFLSLIIFFIPSFSQEKILPLSGIWKIKLDSLNKGHDEKWFAQKLTGDIYLPSTLDEAGYGKRQTEKEDFHLNRIFKYTGPVFFQKEVSIPSDWQNKRISIFLERALWQTEVWIDNAYLGKNLTLSTPHSFVLPSDLKTGKHTITICVDNTVRIPQIGKSPHSYTVETQTNWNGIIGKMELWVGEQVWIDAVKISTNVPGKTITANVTIKNNLNKRINGSLTAMLTGNNNEPLKVQPVSILLKNIEKQFETEITIPITDELKYWDEYEGNIYKMQIRLQSDAKSGLVADTREIPFGIRSFVVKENQFRLNDRPVFLRGNLECCIFPKTGHPPMSVAEWDSYFSIMRSYGLNTIRFHSWCPPDAAFTAADKAGFMFQVELPVWAFTVGQDSILDEFMYEEAKRILNTYGNHPSFTMLCLGNELSGDFNYMDKMVANLKKYDPRRLYTFTDDCNAFGPGPSSDYYVSFSLNKQYLRIMWNRMSKNAPEFNVDFSGIISATKQPVVAHELGQWAVHPDFSEMSEYTGVLKPRNMEQYQQKLMRNGIMDQAKDFQYATGKFAWLVYKEDMETALKTQNFGGYFLLSLQDFPGQSEAMVGLANSFWQDKGILSPQELRQFNDETAALLSYQKAVWRSNESFSASIKVSHYGKKILNNVIADWLIIDNNGKSIASGKTAPININPGAVADLGAIHAELKNIPAATKCKISVRLENTPIENNWEIWVYPAVIDPSPGNIFLTHDWESAKTALKQGKKVLYLSTKDELNKKVIKTDFLPVFWSGVMFKQSNMMGILCDPGHPALKDFPTDCYANWQWWELMHDSYAFVLNGTGSAFKPIVQPVDDFHRGNKLGSVFETAVGKGKLIVCGYDLQSDLEHRPVAKQLLYSILKYMNSVEFNPASNISPAELNILFNNILPQFKAQKVSDLKPGLKYSYYEGKCDSLGDIKDLMSVVSGVSADIDIQKIKKRGDDFAVTFSGFISISSDEDYFFYLSSDDGSELKIDGQTIILSDFQHAPEEIAGKVNLQAGFHSIEINYFEKLMGEILELQYISKSIAKQKVPAAVLFH